MISQSESRVKTRRARAARSPWSRAGPWNRFAGKTAESDFLPRQGLDSATLLELFEWSEEEFMKRLEGSPIRRIGFECWRRNLAVALGNSGGGNEIVAALENALPNSRPMVAEHIRWAIDQLR